MRYQGLEQRSQSLPKSYTTGPKRQETLAVGRNLHLTITRRASQSETAMRAADDDTLATRAAALGDLIRAEDGPNLAAQLIEDTQSI